MVVYLEISELAYSSILGHLLPAAGLRAEETAFVFAQPEWNDNGLLLRCVEWFPVPPEGFAYRSEYYLELTDDTKASMIKRAHDLKACLVEFHSHTDRWTAQFSPSDFEGFDEFVPHVMWRLKNRPYAAVVVTRSGFDALVWTNPKDKPSPLDGISINGAILKPIGLSLWWTDQYDN